MTYLGYQDLIPRRHAWGDPLALPVQSARSNCEYFCLIEFLDAALRQEYSTGGLGLSLDSLNKNAVEEGRERGDGLESCRLVTENFVSFGDNV